ncbi:MAG: hypothetical protein ABR548_06310 [Actinomycetota bacterium]|nr:hypothetical protein [Actinomycetota bacterium]
MLNRRRIAAALGVLLATVVFASQSGSAAPVANPPDAAVVSPSSHACVTSAGVDVGAGSSCTFPLMPFDWSCFVSCSDVFYGQGPFTVKVSWRDAQGHSVTGYDSSCPASQVCEGGFPWGWPAGSAITATSEGGSVFVGSASANPCSAYTHGIVHLVSGGLLCGPGI